MLGVDYALIVFYVKSIIGKALQGKIVLNQSIFYIENRFLKV